jgi:hypothetical protein
MSNHQTTPGTLLRKAAYLAEPSGEPLVTGVIFDAGGGATRGAELPGGEP